MRALAGLPRGNSPRTVRNDERYGCLAYLRLIVRKFTKLGLPLWCSHCQESPVLKVEGSRGSCREMDQMFNLFVRHGMVWFEDICGATGFDYVFQCLIHDFQSHKLIRLPI